jgi:hypothetical protein
MTFSLLTQFLLYIRILYMEIEKHIKSRNLIIAAVLAALLSLVVDNRFGPQPLVWLNFKYGTVVIHPPWLVALFLISAVATFLARRKGANRSQCLLIGISPALTIGTLFSLLTVFIVVMAAFGGRRVYPRDFIGHMLVGWLIIPVAAALLGTLLSLVAFKTNDNKLTT